MCSIYDKHGSPLAWKDGNFLFDLQGNQLPIFLECNGVFNNQGKYLGYYSTGFFRDIYGNTVAFVKGARNGPMLPLTQYVAPISTMAPVYPPLLVMPPIQPVDGFVWSRLSWQEFIVGG